MKISIPPFSKWIFEISKKISQKEEVILIRTKILVLEIEKIQTNNIKNDSMQLYREKLKKFKWKNRREFSASEIMMNSEKIKTKIIIHIWKLKSKYPITMILSSLNINKFVNLSKIKRHLQPWLMLKVLKIYI